VIEKAKSRDVRSYYAIKVDRSSITLENSEIKGFYNRCQVLLINSNSLIEKVNFIDPEIQSKKKLSAICIKGGSPIIKNSTFKKNSYGIKIENGASPLIEENYFEENEKPIYVFESYPSFGENRATNNNFNGILIKGTLSQNTTWQANLPYIVDFYLGVASGRTLTIQPGTVIKMKPASPVSGHQAFFQVAGSLVAEGSKNSPIVFTSLKDDSFPITNFPITNGDTNNDENASLPKYWDWREITFFSGSSGSLKWTTIRYGGYKTNNPLVIQGGANVNVDNETVTIEFSSKPKNRPR